PRRQDCERELAAHDDDRGAGLPFARQHVATDSPPLCEPPRDPCGVLAQRGLDVADRRPAPLAHRPPPPPHARSAPPPPPTPRPPHTASAPRPPPANELVDPQTGGGRH